MKEYFQAYQKYFLDRFTDTGIWSEEIIRKWYEEQSEELLNEVLELLRTAFQRDIIPYAIHEGSKYTVLRLDSRFLGILYIEDLEGKSRTITSLKVWRKK